MSSRLTKTSVKTAIETPSSEAARSNSRSLTIQEDFVPTGSIRRTNPNDHQAGGDVTWQNAMKVAIRDPHELLRRLGLEGAAPLAPDTSFPTFVPMEFLARMRYGDLSDPLLRQVLPLEHEMRDVEGFTDDPVGDQSANVCDHVLHKYEGRALLITTSACGIHCRYCFRREYPYHSPTTRADRWQPALEYLSRQTSIDEVLLSGGDPLTLTDGALFDLLDRIDSIPHVRRIRIHTRMPIVIPQRVTPELVQRLRSARATVWTVVHSNHAQELDDSVLRSLAQMVDAGLPVLNQAVLLRGVNDSVEALVDLFRKLVDHRIQPYYLHQLDRVSGASHFEVPSQVGKRLMREIRQQLPGYAIPTYVQETEGMPHKSAVELLG